MEKRIFKDKVYSILAAVLKSIANPKRLEIADLLSQGEKSVEEIAMDTGMTIANTSQHLQVLKAANLIDTRREGNFIFYSLANEEIYKSLQNLRHLGMDRSAEIGKLMNGFRAGKGKMETLKLDELLTRMNSRTVVLMDVRPASEFNQGHIPGAINIPVEQLSKNLRKLSRRKEYIVYCRGPFCVFADDAVQILIQKGFKAKRLEEGYQDWKIVEREKVYSDR
jgi:DNA-binding transcriptional ArsR family regulator